MFYLCLAVSSGEVLWRRQLLKGLRVYLVYLASLSSLSESLFGPCRDHRSGVAVLGRVMSRGLWMLIDELVAAISIDRKKDMWNTLDI